MSGIKSRSRQVTSHYKIFREYRGNTHSPAIAAENPRTALDAWVRENGARGKVWMLRLEGEILMGRSYSYPRDLYASMALNGL